jgi:hypothetical protein
VSEADGDIDDEAGERQKDVDREHGAHFPVLPRTAPDENVS